MSKQLLLIFTLLMVSCIQSQKPDLYKRLEVDVIQVHYGEDVEVSEIELIDSIIINRFEFIKYKLEIKRNLRDNISKKISLYEEKNVLLHSMIEELHQSTFMDMDDQLKLDSFKILIAESRKEVDNLTKRRARINEEISSLIFSNSNPGLTGEDSFLYVRFYFKARLVEKEISDTLEHVIKKY